MNPYHYLGHTCIVVEDSSMLPRLYHYNSPLLYTINYYPRSPFSSTRILNNYCSAHYEPQLAVATITSWILAPTMNLYQNIVLYILIFQHPPLRLHILPWQAAISSRSNLPSAFNSSKSLKAQSNSPPGAENIGSSTLLRIDKQW